MSYLVLARKYRPQSFDDLVGQEHVAKTLANAIAGRRIAQLSGGEHEWRQTPPGWVTGWLSVERIRDGDPDAYVRRVMMRLAVSCWRRRWRGEIPTEVLPEPAGSSVTGESNQVEERMVLVAALRELPPGQRRVVVLRYVEDLSVEQVAQLLGTSTGTVKSQSLRGLAKLRERLGDDARIR